MTPPFERKPAKQGPVMQLEFGVAGHFKLVAGKKDGSRRELADFHNLLLDQGLNFLLDNTSTGANPNNTPFARAWVGSSSAPEDPEQVGLVAPFASAIPPGSTISSFAFQNIDVFPGDTQTEIRCVRTIRFGEGEAAGIIAEVGMGRGSASQPNLLSCRALVRDQLGNPTTVEVFEDEFLDVTYTLSFFVDLSDRPFTLNLSSGQHDGVLRPGYLSTSVNYTSTSFMTYGLVLTTGSSSTNASASRQSLVSAGTVGPVTDGITGTRTYVGLVRSPKAAIPAPFTRDIDVRVPLTEGNLPGGFSALSIDFRYWLTYQMSFDPPIPKTPEHIFTITLRISLTRR